MTAGRGGGRSGGQFPDALGSLGTVGALGDALAPGASAGDTLGGPLAGGDTLGDGPGGGDAFGGFDATGGAFTSMSHRDVPLSDSLAGDDALRGAVGGTDATAMAMPADVLALDGIGRSANPLSTTDGPVRTGQEPEAAASPAVLPAPAPTAPRQRRPRRPRSGERNLPRQGGPQRGGATRTPQRGSRQGNNRPEQAAPNLPPPAGQPAPIPPPPTAASPGTVPWQGHQPRHAAPRRSRPGQKPVRTGRLIIGLIVMALVFSNLIQSCVRDHTSRYGGTPAPAVTSVR